jgi:predicted transcriptional regulator
MSNLGDLRNENKTKRPNPGPRYSVIPFEFFDNDQISMAHVRVMASICRHTNVLGWCRIKQQTIADQSGLRRPTVCTVLGQLVEWGHIEKHVSKKGKCMSYRALMDAKRAPTDQEFDSLPEIDLEAELSGIADSSPETASSCQHVSDSRCQDSSDSNNDSYENLTIVKKKESIWNPSEAKGKKEGYPTKASSAPKAPLSEAEFAAALAKKKVTIELHPSESGWSAWMDRLSPMLREKAAMAGRIIVSARFPWATDARCNVPDDNVQWQQPSAMPSKGGAA